MGEKGNTVSNESDMVNGTAEKARLAQEVNLSAACPTNQRSLAEAIDEAEREFNVRARCFPGWVKDGRLTRTDAKDRLERLAAACYFLRALSFGDVAGSVDAMDAVNPPGDS